MSIPAITMLILGTLFLLGGLIFSLRLAFKNKPPH